MDLESRNFTADSVPESDSTPQVDGSVEPLSSDSKINSPLSTTDGSPLPSKGFGLRKWRRIRRDFLKEDCNISDATKALKRGLSFPQNVSKPALSVAAGTVQNTEDSSGSVNMPMDPCNVPSASNSDPIFAAQGGDSEHSDDRNSRSSTAASAQRPRHILVKEKHKGKSTAKSFTTSSRHPIEEKAKGEGSKKQRGGGESEHSQSSLESDSRSFAQEVTSSNRSAMNLGGDSGHEFNAGEPVILEEHNFTPFEDNETHLQEENGFSNEGSFDDGQKVNSSEETLQPGGFLNVNGKITDPLADSLKVLDSLHAALQSELTKFGEIRTDNGGRSNSDDERSTCNDDVEDDKKKGENLQVTELKKMVNELEAKLEEALHCQIAKESKSEREVEDIFRQKIEAEIAYLTMSESLKRVDVSDVGDPLTVTAKGSDMKEIEGSNRRMNRSMCLLFVLFFVISVAVLIVYREIDLRPTEVVPT